MPKRVTQYDLLISCPGDVKEEIDAINKAVENFNSTFADTLEISIRVKHWSKNSFPQSGGKPQALLNEQFVNDCDAAVAIMWTRFGTPTDEYGSGTEEEIEIMLQNGKQVFMYFCDKPVNPSLLNHEQYKRIQAFKEKYKDRGMYYTYSSTDDFQKSFFAHLSQYFLSLKAVEHIKEEKRPLLLISGIDSNNHITNTAVMEDFKLSSQYDREGYIKKIKEYYDEIMSIKTVDTASALLNTSLSVLSPVKIDVNTETYIRKMAELLNVELSDNFFDLGNLHKPIASLPMYNSVNGSDDEVRKYQLINALCEIIQDFLKWGSVDKALVGIKYVGLILTNCGTDYDEDVEVSLTFPIGSIVTAGTFPEISDGDKNYLMNDRDLDEIFHIPATANYLDYNDSITRPLHISTSVKPVPDIFGASYDNSDRFYECLSAALGFEAYTTETNNIIKIKFEYIKHNTSVAFPSILLLISDITEIPYTITSKHCPEKLNGVITVTK